MVCQSNLRLDKPSVKFLFFLVSILILHFGTCHVSSHKYFSIPLPASLFTHFCSGEARSWRQRVCFITCSTRFIFYYLSLSTSWNTHRALHHVSAPDEMKTFNLAYFRLNSLSVSTPSPGVTSEADLNWRCSAAHRVSFLTLKSFRVLIIHYLETNFCTKLCLYILTAHWCIRYSYCLQDPQFGLLSVFCMFSHACMGLFWVFWLSPTFPYDMPVGGLATLCCVIKSVCGTLWWNWVQSKVYFHLVPSVSVSPDPPWSWPGCFLKMIK